MRLLPVQHNLEQQMQLVPHSHIYPVLLLHLCALIKIIPQCDTNHIRLALSSSSWMLVNWLPTSSLSCLLSQIVLSLSQVILRGDITCRHVRCRAAVSAAQILLSSDAVGKGALAYSRMQD